MSHSQALRGDLALHRSWKTGNFGPRECRLVAIVHDGVAGLFGEPAGPTLAAHARCLPPQLKRLFGCLLDGLTEKECAAVMGLRPNTVHFYVRRLYDRLYVRSHLELLARYARERDGRPRLFGDPGGPPPVLREIDVTKH